MMLAIDSAAAHTTRICRRAGNVSTMRARARRHTRAVIGELRWAELSDARRVRLATERPPFRRWGHLSPFVDQVRRYWSTHFLARAAPGTQGATWLEWVIDFELNFGGVVPATLAPGRADSFTQPQAQ